MPTDWSPDETITSDELAVRLAEITAATIASVTLETPPTRLRKTGNPWYDRDTKSWSLIKRQRLTCVIGGRYASAVNRRRQGIRAGVSDRSRRNAVAASPLFRARRRTWGERLGQLPLVVYRSRLYLDVQKLDSFEVKYLDLADGSEVTAQSLLPWMSERDQARVREHQGIPHVVEWRDFRLTSVCWLRVFGRLYKVNPVTGPAS